MPQLDDMGRELAQALGPFMTWKTDDRFSAVLGEFNVKQQDEVRAILERFLPQCWDYLSIRRAPAEVRAVGDGMGGLQPGQILFTSVLGVEAFVFCAWWPWGNKVTISLRVAPRFILPPETGTTGTPAAFKAHFGL